MFYILLAPEDHPLTAVDSVPAARLPSQSLTSLPQALDLRLPEENEESDLRTKASLAGKSDFTPTSR